MFKHIKKWTALEKHGSVWFMICSESTQVLRPCLEVAIADEHTKMPPASWALLWCFMQVLTGGVCLPYHSSMLWFVLYGFCIQREACFIWWLPA